MKWRIYYEDGSICEKGLPQDSPVWGAVAIAQHTEKFQKLLVKGPYFLYRTDWDCWMECEFDGLLDNLAHQAHVISCVRIGRYIRNDVFKAIWKRARADADA